MGMNFRDFYTLLELVTEPATNQNLPPDQVGKIVSVTLKTTLGQLPNVKFEEKDQGEETHFDLKTPDRIITVVLNKVDATVDIQFNWSSTYRNNNYDNFSTKDSRTFFPVQSHLQADTPVFLNAFKAFLTELRKYPLYVQYESLSSPYAHKRSDRRANLYDKILRSVGYTLNSNNKPIVIGNQKFLKKLWTPPALNPNLHSAPNHPVSVATSISSPASPQPSA